MARKSLGFVFGVVVALGCSSRSQRGRLPQNFRAIRLRRRRARFTGRTSGRCTKAPQAALRPSRHAIGARRLVRPSLALGRTL